MVGHSKCRRCCGTDKDAMACDAMCEVCRGIGANLV